MTFFLDLDTEQVIHEVHKRPLLWDKNYLIKLREERNQAWVDIATEIVINFDTLGPYDKSIIVNKIYQRWRTARDAYKKDKAMKMQASSSAKKHKKYAYYDNLTFLDSPSIDPAAAAVASIKDPEDKHFQKVLIIDKQSSEPSDCSISTLVDIEQSDGSDDDHYMDDDNSQVSAVSLQRQDRLAVSDTQPTDGHQRSNQLILEDEDLAFFQSLQPTLKRFSNYQKLQFRSQILQVVMEIEKQNNETNNTERETFEFEIP